MVARYSIVLVVLSKLLLSTFSRVAPAVMSPNLQVAVAEVQENVHGIHRQSIPRLHDYIHEEWDTPDELVGAGLQNQIYGL